MKQSFEELSNTDESFSKGKQVWFWPIIICFSRLFLAFAAQAIVAGIFVLRNHPEPWQAAAPWWVVYGTLIDLGCLFLIWRLVKKEGIKLGDLITKKKSGTGKFILITIGLVLLYFVLFMAGGMIAGPLIYGSTTPPTPYGSLPLWGAMYSILIWPIIWGFAEQLTYLGYSLPRLEGIFRNKWLPIIIITLGWSIQHVALPFHADWSWVIYRFLSSIPIAIGLTILYMKVRRLWPFIIAHILLDAAGTIIFVLLPIFE